MITELRAQNFKSWQDTGPLQFAPLTGLFGANSSGKTSILQVLLMLKQTVEQPADWNEPLYFGDDGSLVNLGSFDDIIHRPANNRSLNIFLSWKLPKKLTIRNISEIDTFSFFLNIFMGISEGFGYKFGENSFRADPVDGLEPEISTPYGGDRAQSLFRCYGIRGTSPATQEIFSVFEEAFKNLFSQILYLGPLREYPRRRYPWKGDHPKGIGQYGEKTTSALLSGRIRRLPVDEQIPKWLQKLELIDSYDVQPVFDTGGDYELLVKQYKDGPEVPLTDVGFGVSQVLPVLILCYYAPEGSILILEQPEAHLHPKVQSELADVLIDVVKNRNVQIILESHSAHLLHRLQRRIAEEQILAADTALYFCQINDGTSKIEQLDLDEYGNIRNWPQNFFGDDLGDLVEKTKAEMQRRKVME